MLAFALVFSAHAADLAVHLDWTGAPAPLDVVIADPTPGALPALTVPDGEGQWRRVEITWGPRNDQQIEYAVSVYTERDIGRGRRESTLISKPVILALVGNEATVKQGARVRDGAEYEMSLVLRYGDAAAEE